MDVALATAIFVLATVVTAVVYGIAKYQAISFVMFAIILNLLALVAVQTIEHTSHFCAYDNSTADFKCTSYTTYENNNYMIGYFIINIIILSVIAFFKITDKAVKMMR